MNGHGSHLEPIGLLDGPAPIDATTGRKRFYASIPYGRVNGGLDPERISEEQWIEIGEEELRCGQYPDVGPPPGRAGCAMPPEIQKLFIKRRLT